MKVRYRHMKTYWIRPDVGPGCNVHSASDGRSVLNAGNKGDGLGWGSGGKGGSRRRVKRIRGFSRTIRKILYH